MNKMTHEQFLLLKLAEEASEIAQIALKTAQFGMTEKHPDMQLNNKERIHLELNDLLAVVGELNDWAQFGFKENYEAKINKIVKLNKYLGYSIQLGKVENIPAIFGEAQEPANEKIMNEQKFIIQPVDLPDDLKSNWFHPDIKKHNTIEEGEEGYTQEQWEQLKKNLGVEIIYDSWDYMDIPEIPEEDCTDWSDWKPIAPEEGLFLIGAYDSEDGPVLWWAKERLPEAVVKSLGEVS